MIVSPVLDCRRSCFCSPGFLSLLPPSNRRVSREVLQDAYQAVSSGSGGSSAAGATDNGVSFGALAESLEPQQHERMKLQAAEMT